MTTFDTHGDRRRSPTDWLGGGEGAPADDRVAGGQSTPDEVIRPTSDVISQLLPWVASDLEALRGVFDANRSGGLIDDDNDDDDNDNDDETDDADDSDGSLPAGNGDLPNGITGDDRVADMPGQEVNTRDNLGVVSIYPPQSFLDGLRMQPGSGRTGTDGATEIAGERSLADDTETAGGGSPQGDVREALGCDSFDLDATFAAFIEWAGRLRDLVLELRDGMPADPSAHSETSDQSRGQVDVTVDTRSSVPSQDVVLVPWHHQDDFRFI